MSNSCAWSRAARWRSWSPRTARSRTASSRRRPACRLRPSSRPAIFSAPASEAARRDARKELDDIAARLVEAGLVSWSGAGGSGDQLIVRGQANLLGDVRASDDLERIRTLFADLETKTDVIELLHRAETGEGVKIFIGSENKLFSLSGSSMIAAPLRDSEHRIAGVLGVIGPTRLNYGRIVPMVEYAAQVLGDLKRPR